MYKSVCVYIERACTCIYMHTNTDLPAAANYSRFKNRV